jgi:hypothetical protein
MGFGIGDILAAVGPYIMAQVGWRKGCEAPRLKRDARPASGCGYFSVSNSFRAGGGNDWLLRTSSAIGWKTPAALAKSAGAMNSEFSPGPSRSAVVVSFASIPDVVVNDDDAVAVRLEPFRGAARGGQEDDQVVKILGIGEDAGDEFALFRIESDAGEERFIRRDE